MDLMDLDASLKDRTHRNTAGAPAGMLQRRCSVPQRDRRRCVAAAVLIGASGVVGAQEVLQNPGFESGGVVPWFGTGTSQLSVSTDAFAGQFALLTSGRTSTWNGPNQNMAGLIESGRAYEFGVRVKLLGGGPQQVFATLRIDDALGERFLRLAAVTADPGEWRRLSTFRSLSLVEPVNAVQFYVEGPPSGVSYLIDEATVRPIDGYDWRAEADAAIDTLRKGDLVVSVVDQDGLPREDAIVAVEQRERDFRFGTAVNANELDNPEYTAFVLENYNSATAENAWKWYATEPFQGFETYGTADAFRDFAVSNGLKIHGHTVHWAVDQFVPGWVQGLTGAALRNAADQRTASVVQRYDGVVDAWDVNNEMVHGSFYESRLPGFRVDLFQQVRALDPDVPLFVNDYNILTGSDMDAYLDQIAQLRADGAPIDGVGLQAHYQNFALDPFVLRAKLDRIAADTGLPIRITEYDYVRDGASYAERADALEVMYRTAYGHPAVEAITMWGFWAGSHWRGEGAALVELDWAVNPVGLRYQELLDEWRTNTSVLADGEGEASFRVFHGVHEVRAIDSEGGDSGAELVSVLPGDGVVGVTLVLPRTPCNRADVAPPRGTLDAMDLVVFISSLNAGDLDADLDGDGQGTMFDLLIALADFDAGCD
jgi:endo-1,4-beta-xylanase